MPNVRFKPDSRCCRLCRNCMSCLACSFALASRRPRSSSTCRLVRRSPRNPRIWPGAEFAARLLSITPPDTVVVDERTRLLLGNLFAFESLGPNWFKGFTMPVLARRAGQPRDVQSRFAARRDPDRSVQCVGRDKEIGILLAAISRAATDGLKTVVVTGDPGIGKSRLLHEASKQLRADGGTVLNGDCTPGSQGAPFAALMDAFRRSFGLSLTASEAVTCRRLRRASTTLGSATDENVALFLNLLGFVGSSTGEPDPPMVLGGRKFSWSHSCRPFVQGHRRPWFWRTFTGLTRCRRNSCRT